MKSLLTALAVYPDAMLIVLAALRVFAPLRAIIKKSPGDTPGLCYFQDEGFILKNTMDILAQQF